MAAPKPAQCHPMRCTGKYGRDNSQHDQPSAESDCALMQPNARGGGRFLPQCTEECDQAKAEGGHSERRPDPGKGGPVEGELGSKARQASPF